MCAAVGTQGRSRRACACHTCLLQTLFAVRLQFAQAVLLEAVSSSPAAVEALQATGAQEVFQQASVTLVCALETVLVLCYAWCRSLHWYYAGH